jgi:hypothetical protein
VPQEGRASGLGVVAENLLLLLRKLTEKDRQNIAKAVRRKGLLTDLPHFGHVTSDRIAFLNREEVIAALREAAPTYPEVLDTIRKLQGN